MFGQIHGLHGATLVFTLTDYGRELFLSCSATLTEWTCLMLTFYEIFHIQQRDTKACR